MRVTKSILVLSFASDWLRAWRQFSKPIAERSEVKPMQSRFTFDAQFKIALYFNTLIYNEQVPRGAFKLSFTI